MGTWVGLGCLAIGLCGPVAMASAQSKPNPPPENRVTIRKAADKKVEVTVTSKRRFPVVGAIAVLSIGKERSQLSRHPDDGDTHTLIFTMPADEFAKTKDGDRIEVRYDPDSQGRWEFGKLDKSKVRK